MNSLITKLGIAFIVIVLLPYIAVAAEVDHSKMDHSKMGHGMNGPKIPQPKAVKKGSLKSLSTMPSSGRAREAGSDGRYAMEATSTRTRFSEKCAQATRGLIILDNASWKRCGGKPKGVSMGIANKTNQTSGQMDHSKMKH